MKILIDNNYETIYGGEFKNMVEKLIIEPLEKNSSNELFFTKNDDELEDILSYEEFDLIIHTGYSCNFLRWIKKYQNTKVISLIYDMNAEKLSDDMERKPIFDKIVSAKAHLIFLSSAIIVFSDTVKNDIIKYYSEHTDKINLDKIYKLDFNYTSETSENISKKLFSYRYVVLPLPHNGFSEAIIIPALVDNLEKSNIKIVCPIISTINKTFLQMVNDNDLSDNIKFVKDLSDSETDSLYRNAIASLFVSEYDTDCFEILKSLSNHCITLLSQNNDSYKEFGGDNIGYYDPDQNINEVLQTLANIDEDEKEMILEFQDDLLNRLNMYQPTNTLDAILDNVLNN